MFPRCANRLGGIGSAAGTIAACVALLLTACSSSPTKDEPIKPAAQQVAQDKADKDTKKTSAKKPDAKNAIKDEVAPAPVGPPPPPPIPPEATQQFEKALTLLGAGDFGPAAKEFQALSTAYPNYSGPLINLGIVYLKTDKLADAEKALKAATQRGEPSAAAFNQLGIVYRKLGRFKEADDAYSQALRIDPGYSLAHLNLGVLCDMYLQQPQRALSEFERYLQLVPKPDARVPTWVKELQGRVGSKSAPPNSSPAPAAGSSTPAPTTPPPTSKD